MTGSSEFSSSGNSPGLQPQPADGDPEPVSDCPRGRNSGLLGRRAVVIGAGMGGLPAAGALAEYFEEVEIIERDGLPASAGSRSGTPQDRHRTACWPAACARSKGFSPVSSAISPQPALSPLVLHATSSSSIRMSGCCPSGISGSQCCAQRGR